MSARDRDPFAFGGVHDNAELFALIAEYRRLEARANERGIDEDETARRCDEAREIREQIARIRPTTLRGVLAVLDHASEIEDPHHWPDEAIEGLRSIIEREGLGQ